MRARTRTWTRACTWTATPRTVASGCASLCTVLATARFVQGPACACASASARRPTYRPGGLDSDQATNPGPGQGAQRSVLGPADAGTQGQPDVSRGPPLPGPLLLKASGPAPTENKRRWVLAGAGSGGEGRPASGRGRRPEGAPLPAGSAVPFGHLLGSPLPWPFGGLRSRYRQGPVCVGAADAPERVGLSNPVSLSLGPRSVRRFSPRAMNPMGWTSKSGPYTASHTHPPL